MTAPTLTQSAGSQFTRIYSYGAARGDLVVDNNQLVEAIDSSDEWIQQRTGMITRRRASPGILALDLATDAAREAIEKSGVDPSEIGVVIVATISNVQQSPSISAVVADRVGANPAAAYDMNAACAGFSYAVTQADALIRSGAAKYALVIGAEKLSDLVDPTDRRPTLRQEGQTVFRWAVWDMAKVAKQALDVAGISADDLAAFIPHQANMRIIDEFAKQLKLPESVVIARDIADMGNSSAASIPLATHRLLEEHPELSGGLALQIGFGAGLDFGAQVIVLP